MIEDRSKSSAEVRPVSATWGELVGPTDASIFTARKTILDWISKRSDESVPAAAYDGGPFSLALGHGEVVAGNGLWALRFDTSDEDLREEEGIERRWRTEIVIANPKQGNSLFSVKLSVITATSGVPFIRSAPQLVRDLSVAPGLIFDGERYGSNKIGEEAKVFFEFLLRHDRRPVIAVAENEMGTVSVDIEWLRRFSAGFAHVVRVPDQLASEIRRRYGRKWSVYGGAIRIYMPGVLLGDDGYRASPIITQKTIPNEKAEQKRFLRRLTEKMLSFSVLRHDLDEQAPGFLSIRSHLQSLAIAGASKAAAKARADVEAANTNEDKISAQAREIEAMRLEQDALRSQARDIEEKLRESLQERDLAYDGNQELEQEVDRLKKQVFSVNARARIFEAKLLEGGEKIQIEIEHPASYEDLDDWAEKYYPDRLIILPKAIKAAKKSEYEDVEHIGRCLSLLAVEYVDMRRGVVGAQDLYQKKCNDLRVEVSPVGSALQNHRYKHQFVAPYQNGYAELDLHLSPASGTAERGSVDPKKTYRIYFSWDRDQELVVVGSMPSHLTTTLTN